MTTDHAPLHWRNGGKAWKASLEAAGLPPDTVLCGDLGDVATRADDVSCPICAELRTGVMRQDPDRLILAIKTARESGSTVPDALAKLGSAQPGQAAGEAGAGDAAGLAGLLSLVTPSKVGTFPYWLARLYIQKSSGGERDLIPPPAELREALGGAVLSMTGDLPDWLIKLLSSPLAGIVALGVIATMQCKVVHVEVTDDAGPSGEDVKIPAKVVNNLWSGW